MKKLEKILESVKVLNDPKDLSKMVNGIYSDSRRCIADSMFIAYAGTAQDSHNYISSAVANGAQVIVLDNKDYLGKHNVNYVLVPNSQQVIGILAANYYEDPSSEMTIVGITGTNGKTTTAYLLYDLLFRQGYNCGLISTIEIKYGSETIPSRLTTPDAISLQRVFRKMSDSGVSHVLMEVSSHAIDQGRVAEVNFDHTVFTNLTHDHLDYHETFKSYLTVKKKLFDGLSEAKTALVNIDDPNGKVMVQNSDATVYEYSLHKPCRFKGKIISNDLSGLQMNIDGHEIFLRMVGAFNAYNAVVAYAMGNILGLDVTDVLSGLSDLVTAEGRLDIVKKEGVNYTVVVDYAHTPDALEKVLETLVETKNKLAKLITVVGCGGDRDRTKRPKMAKIAARLSDIVLLTSDNPRSEKPDEIIEEMYAGLNERLEEGVFKFTDRTEAIKMACHMASKNDVVLVAGKGHEKYQEIKGERFPFDDKKIALKHMS